MFKIYNHCLDIHRSFHEHNVMFSTMLHDTGIFYLFKIENSIKAEELFQEAYEIRKKILGMEHLSTLKTKQHLQVIVVVFSSVFFVILCSKATNYYRLCQLYCPFPRTQKKKF